MSSPGNEAESSILAFWLQAMIYGAYLPLFMSAFVGMIKNWQRCSRVFFVGTTILFSLETIDTVSKGYTLVLAYGGTLTRGDSMSILHNYGRWDTFTQAVCLNFTIWIADFLVIYRCYIIWGGSIRVIVVPCLLLVLSIVTNSVVLRWFLHPEPYLLTPVNIFFQMGYPVNLAQNVLTTGLIIFKILHQHCESAALGVRLVSGVSLVGIACIIVESAFVYTLHLLILCVLFQMQHNATVIFQFTLASSASITFPLMSMRIDNARSHELTSSTQSGFRFEIPTWAIDLSSPSANHIDSSGHSVETNSSEVETHHLRLPLP